MIVYTSDTSNTNKSEAVKKDRYNNSRNSYSCKYLITRWFCGCDDGIFCTGFVNNICFSVDWCHHIGAVAVGIVLKDGGFNLVLLVH